MSRGFLLVLALLAVSFQSPPQGVQQGGSVPSGQERTTVPAPADTPEDLPTGAGQSEGEVPDGFIEELIIPPLPPSSGLGSAFGVPTDEELGLLKLPPGNPPIVSNPYRKRGLSGGLILSEVDLTGAATGTGFSEKFFLQLPLFMHEQQKVPLLIAFHGSGNTALQIIQGTDYPEEARARNWFLLAPLGASQVHNSAIPSQINTRVVLDMVLDRYGKFIDMDRIYGVGFSMGGGAVLNYAARHLDTDGPMFAAIVNHTGGLALKHTYLSVANTSILEFWFGGDPTAEPFNYERSSLIDFHPATLVVDTTNDLARNLTHIPILNHRVANDPLGYVLVQNQVFHDHMVALGGDVTERVITGTEHLWSTLDATFACNWLDQQTLRVPNQSRVLADSERRYFYFDVNQGTSGEFTPFTWRFFPKKNRLDISETENLISLTFAPEDLGLDIGEPMEFNLSTSDGVADDLIISGFPTPPVVSYRDGIETTVQYNVGLGAIKIPEADGTAPHQWIIWHLQATADLTVDTIVDVPNPTEQSQVIFRATVTNNGPANATGIELTSQLPAGVTLQSAVPEQGSYDSMTETWTVGDLARGNSVKLDLFCTVDVGQGGATLTFQATGLTGDRPDPVTGNETDSVGITVDDNADLGLAKVADKDFPLEGETVVYTITLSNASGGAQATNVAVTDSLPFGVTYVSDVASQGSYDDGTGVWTVGTVDAGSNATLDITVTVDPGTFGLVVDNVLTGLTADQPDPNAANDTASAQFTVVDEADLSIVKVVDDALPSEGQTIVYTITLTNGTIGVPATSVQLTDLLPAGVTYVSDVPSQGSYDDTTGLWTVGTIPGLLAATLDLTATVDVGTGGQQIINTASGLSADQPDPNGLNDSDTAAINVDDQADLSITKGVDDATPIEGQNVVYTITVANAGGGAQATNVSLTDVLPAGVTYVSDVPSQGSYVSGTGLWTVGTLDSGNNATLTLTASVDAGTGGDVIVNTAAGLTADQPDPVAGNDTDDASITVENEADLSITKVVDEAFPEEGEQVTFTITVTNNPGGAQAENVSLTDLLPAGVTLANSIPSQGSYVFGTGVWTVGTLATGASATLDLTVTVDAGQAGNTIVNTANGLGADQTDTNPANDSDSAQIDVVFESDLGVTKVVDDDTPLEGGTVIYTITLTNAANGADATNVTLTDLLPAGVTYVSDTPSQGSYVAGTGLWTVGSLASGASATLDITASVDVGTGGDLISNVAGSPTADQTDPNATNDSDTADLTVEDEADLAVTKVVDDATPIEGQSIVYTITLENTAGGAQATNVSLVDLLPVGVTYVSDLPSQGSYVAGTGLWTVGTLDTGTNATLAITATVDAGSGGSVIVNTAGPPLSDQSDSNAANDTDTADITVENENDLSVTKVVDDPTPTEQQNVVYTVTVANAGPAQAENVAITDLLPAGVSFVSAIPSQGSYVHGTGLWTVGTIASGANATLDITASVDVATGGSLITNTASGLTQDQTDTNGTNDSDTADITVEADADLAVDKVVDDATPIEQGTVVYTITVTNPLGGAQATNVSLTDLLPAGVTYVSDVPSQGSYVSGTGVWTVGTLDGDSNATLAITATVDVGTGGDLITNTASGLASDAPDPNPANDSDTADLTVENEADLGVTKTVDEAFPEEGEQVTFTVVVDNALGGARAENATLTDPVPAGLTFVSAIPSQGSYVHATGVWTIGTIDSGSSATLDITASVDAGQAGNVIINSTAALGADQTDPNPANDTDSAQVTVVFEVDLSVTKGVTDATPTEGQTITYTLTLANAADMADATNVSITDLLPAGVTYVSDNPSQGSYVSGTGVWTVGTVASGANATLELTATVDAGTGGTAIVNSTTGLSADQTDTNGANDADSIQITVENETDLSVSLVVDDATPVEQGTVVYTLTVANAGPAQAENVSITDLLPSGVTYASDTPSQGSYVSGTGVWTVGTIASGANATLDISATVDAGTGGTLIANTTGSVSSDQTDTNGSNDSDSVDITVENETDLSVTLVVDDATPIEQGTVVYTLTVANGAGGAQAQNVSITDLLPSGVTYVSDNPSQGSYVSGTGVWTVGTIASGSNATLGITATVDVGTGGTLITNTTGSVTADRTDSNASNNSDSVGITVENEAELAVTLVVDDATPKEQDTVVYTLTVANGSGGAQAENVSITDLLPSGVTYVSDNPSQGSYVSGTGVWTVGTIASGSNATLGITATVDTATGGTLISNTTGSVSADQADTNATDDSDSVDITVENEADLSASLAVDDATPDELATIVYTLTVANASGGAEAQNVTITDLLPSGVTYVSDNPSQGSYVSGTGVWTVGTIASGSNATLDITVTVDSGTTGTQITNTTSGLAADQTDGNASNDVGSIAIDVN